MKSLKRVILKHIIQLFTKISEGDDRDLTEKVQETYGSVLKLGAIEDTKNRDKLAALASFTTNHRNRTTFNHVGDFFHSCFLVLMSDSISNKRERARNRYSNSSKTELMENLFSPTDFLPC